MPEDADRLMRFVLGLRQGGVTDARVLSALERTPRTHFAPAAFAAFAYDDRELPIGDGQTMTAPSLVARVLMALELKGGESVLEVGTGSGYQAAALGALARRVVSLERRQGLAAAARGRIGERRLMHVYVHYADGHDGWAQDAPFDRIVVNGAVSAPPATLWAHLAEGGVLVAPVHAGRLASFRKAPDAGVDSRDHGPAVLPPLESGRAD